MPDRLDLPRRYRDQIEALLREHVPGVAVWAYGSRVNGQSHEASDLDLVLRGPDLKRISSGQLTDLTEALEQSNVPILVQIHDWARLPESFHREIEQEYVVLVDEEEQNVRDGWHEIPFAQLLAEPVRNGIYKKKEFHGRGVKIVNMREIFAYPRLRDVHMKRVELSEREKHRSSVIKGDLLFARRSFVAEGAGKCSVVLEADEPTTFESSIIRARPDPTKAYSLFLYYYFSSTSGLHALDSIRRQVAVAGITGSDLVRLNILVPPLPEQRAIAHILGTLDDKIELNRRMNETLEDMARALFKSWFVDFDPVRAKMEGRDPGLPKHLADLFPDRLVDSELGPIPEGWEVSEIGREVDVVGGSTPSTKEPAFWEEGNVHWATPKDLSRIQSPVLIETERKITSAGLQKISSDLLPVGTVLMSSRAPVGYLAIAQVPLAVNQGFIAMKCSERISKEYTLSWCYENMDIIKANAGGTTFQEISKRNFRPLKVIVPTTGILKVYDSIVNPLFEKITLNVHESHTLAAQREALLPKLVSGDLRVDVRDK